jgi:hypothetical protein
LGLSCHGFSVGFVSGVFLVGVVRLGVSRFVIFADRRRPASTTPIDP